MMAVVGGMAGQLPKVWMDEGNGYAIGGFDPVDYFVRGEAVLPDSDIEAFWGGVSWKFRNIGNKQAFLSHPFIYAPQFGGTDPYLLAKGRLVNGNPSLFDLYEGGLYLFYDGKSLLSWKQNRATFIRYAKQVWPQAALRQGLDATPSNDNSDQESYLQQPENDN